MRDDLRKVSRRSFLSRVVGGAVIGTVAVAATIVPTEEAEAQTDSDTGRYADPAGRGRRRHRSGITDRDSGRYGDPAGNGRGRRGRQHRRTGITDSDPRDPAGNGRGGHRPRSCSDSDSGHNADPGGRGRHC